MHYIQSTMQSIFQDHAINRAQKKNNSHAIHLTLRVICSRNKRSVETAFLSIGGSNLP